MKLYEKTSSFLYFFVFPTKNEKNGTHFAYFSDTGFKNNE